ncbi:MAG: glutaminyl-tRNA synthetase, partial [Arcticibacterium sp.]
LDDKFQFMRKGYYVLDKESSSESLVFNQTVSLRDSWKKK